MKSSFKPALLLMAGRCAAFVVTFLIPVVLVRTFDQEGYGTYKQLFLVYSTLFAVAQFGMAESLYYFIPNHLETGGKTTANATLMLAALGGACAALLSWQADRIAQWLHNPAAAGYLPWIGAYLALALMGASIEIAMVSRKRFALAAVTMCASEALRAALFILPALLTGELKWMLAGGVLFGCVRLAGGAVFAFHEFRGELRPDAGLMRKQLAYALPFQLAVLAETVQANYHQFAVSYYFDAATFAIYAVGCLQIPAFELLAAPAANVMMVGMSEELKEGRKSSALAIWGDTTRKLLMLLLPLTGFLVVASRDLILFLFTKVYVASASIFAFWALSTVFQAFPTDAVLRVYADTRYILALNVVRLVLVASFIGYAMSRFGLVGPVLVALGATLVAKVLAMKRIARLMSAEMKHIIDWKAAAVSLVIALLSGMAAVSVRNRFDAVPLAGLIILGCVYGVCCAGMFAAWWLLKARSIRTCAELPESSV